MIFELSLACLLQADPASELKQAAELMDRATEYLHQSARAPNPGTGTRKGSSLGSLDLSIERQKEARDVIDLLLKEMKNSKG
jgi:hypothetical protein